MMHPPHTPTAYLAPAAIARLGHGTLAPDLPHATGVSVHCAQVTPGDAFFALPGRHSHGIRYADAALAAGAAFIVSDQPHPRGVQVADPAGVLLGLGREARAQLAGPLIGVTGSAGKTSTKTMLAAATGAHATRGNLNTPLALAQFLIGAHIDAYLNKLSGPLVLELGIDHPGEMDTLVGLVRPDYGVLTLIAASHLSGLGDVTTVAREKRKLVQASRAAFVSAPAAPYLDASERHKSQVYGLDSDTLEEDLEGGCDVQGKVQVDVQAEVLSATAAGQTLRVLGATFTLPYPGKGMARNAAAAIAVAAQLGTEPHEAAARLETVRLEPGRLERHTLPGLILIDDSYNSSPASARLALAVLARCERPHTAILGDMLELGDDAATLHRELGEAARGVDLLLSHGEMAAHLAAAHGNGRHFERFEALIDYLRAHPPHGTVLVKASRGMRFERVADVLKERRA